jgi:hypothetical protein
MGHLVKTEIFDQGNKLEDAFSVNTPGWEGIWQAVHAEMERSGRRPSGMEELDDGAVKDNIRSIWEHDDMKTGSFYFAGPDWSAITVSWNGKTEDVDE